MKMIIYPGSFDPITCGHLDLIERAARMTDNLVVAVLHNGNKQGFFTIPERVEMIKKCVSNLPNVTVDSSEGLLVNYIRRKGGNVMLRGLRAVSDFEYELQYAMLNQKREIGSLGGNITGMVPEIIRPYVSARLCGLHTEQL